MQSIGDLACGNQLTQLDPNRSERSARNYSGDAENRIINLSSKSALHEYIVRKEKMPEARLKNRESPLEGYEEIPVRVILIPAQGKQSPRKMQ